MYAATNPGISIAAATPGVAGLGAEVVAVLEHDRPRPRSVEHRLDVRGERRAHVVEVAPLGRRRRPRPPRRL